MQSLEPAFDGALMKHLIRLPRLGNAFKLEGSQIAVFEEVTEEPPRSTPRQGGGGNPSALGRAMPENDRRAFSY
jgi:hypothetical protein